MPFQILFVWLRGICSILLLLGGLYLLREWHRQSHIWIAPAASQPTGSAEARREFHYEPGLNRQTALLGGAVAALLCTFAGGPLLLRMFWRRGKDDPKHTRGGTVHHLTGEEGARLHVETYGTETGRPVVLTHGLGTDSEEWYYLKRDLAATCAITVWDTPGLGRSTRPATNDYELPTLAGNLMTVARDASSRSGGQPVVLIGHSMGGMIQLELGKLFPDEIGRVVGAIVQVHTTYTNPVKTAKSRRLYGALQKPLLEPLLHLTVWLSPLVRLMQAMSYLNGSTHLSNMRSGFAGTETWGQLDFVARYSLKSSPAVNARVALAMLRWDATAAFAAIKVPTLVVPGDRDPICAPDASRTMQASISGATLAALSPGKHYGMIEHHEAFTRSVESFVAQCSPVRR